MINNFFPKIRLAIKEKLDLKPASNFAETSWILTFNTGNWISALHITEPIPINVVLLKTSILSRWITRYI